MSTRFAWMTLPALLALVGCGSSSAEVSISATQFRPEPARTAVVTGAGSNLPAVPESEDETGTPVTPITTPEVMDTPPDKTPTGTPIARTDGDPTTVTPPEGTGPKTPDPDPEPDPDDPPGDEPSNIRLAIEAPSLPVTATGLAGEWRAEGLHYVVQKGEVGKDEFFHVVRFLQVPDKRDRIVDVYRVAREVNGRLVPVAESQFTVDTEGQRIRFGTEKMPAPLSARLVEEDRLEVRDRSSGYTVIRYYERIPG